MKFLKPLRIRSSEEEHRQATWVELFIDLGYVVAIASLTSIFDDGFNLQALLKYSCFFFIIFWIWNRYTWYASLYDNDDVFFRFTYLFSILPVIGLVHAFPINSKGSIDQAIISFAIANFILLLLWGRVFILNKNSKTHVNHFFYGYIISTSLIITSLFTPDDFKYIILISSLMVEIFTPILGWRNTGEKIPIHSDHIIERHGLFSIILLGEGVVAISKNFDLINTNQWYLLIAGFLIVIFNWWIYFDCGFGFKTELMHQMKRVFFFGYGHFFIFLSLALTAIGLEHGLHGILHTSHAKGFSSIAFTVISLGAFLIFLSIIQTIVSVINPTRIYVTRVIAGITLILLPLYIHQFTLIILITFVLTLIVLLNEVYTWALIDEESQSLNSN